MVVAAGGCQAQADRGGAGGVARQRYRTAVEEVDQCRIAQDQAVGGVVGVVAGLQVGDLRCNDGHGRHQQGVDAGQLPFDLGDPATAAVDDVEQVGGADVFAAQDARHHALVVVFLTLGDQLAMPGPCFGGGETAFGVDGGQFAERRYGLFDDDRAGCRQLGDGRLHAGGDMVVHA